VLVGLAVSCTLPDAERLLGAHNAEIVDMEASLELKADAIQGAAPWDLDRIDQVALPLDSQYHHSSYRGVHPDRGMNSPSNGNAASKRTTTVVCLCTTVTAMLYYWGVW